MQNLDQLCQQKKALTSASYNGKIKNQCSSFFTACKFHWPTKHFPNYFFQHQSSSFFSFFFLFFWFCNKLTDIMPPATSFHNQRFFSLLYTFIFLQLLKEKCAEKFYDMIFIFCTRHLSIEKNTGSFTWLYIYCCATI